MALPAALHLAFDLARNPRLAPLMQRRPLPPDVLVLIQIAANDQKTVDEMSSLTGRKPEVLRKVAVLYVQQVLWGGGADHYRTLGVQRSASREQIAEHLRWLTKWIHPDRQHLPQERAFSSRVFSAWNALKTPQRRQQYDQTLEIKSAVVKSRGVNRSLRRLPWIDKRADRSASDFHLTVWRVVGAVAVAAGLVGWVMTADWWVPVTAHIPRREAAPSGAAQARAPDKPVIDENFSFKGNPVVSKAAGPSD